MTDKSAIVARNTRCYKYAYPYHCDNDVYIDLGEKFAESVYLLSKKWTITSNYL